MNKMATTMKKILNKKEENNNKQDATSIRYSQNLDSIKKKALNSIIQTSKSSEKE